ncbi:MAG: ArnT family glycosyltransferase [Geminicoccaceae bacterium]
MSSASRQPAMHLAGWRSLEFWVRPTTVVGVLVAYSLVHFALRFYLSPTLGLDDAEQAMFGQELRLGYRFRQPPLYTWLLWGTIQFAGINLFAITIVNYVVLLVCYLFFYAAARLALQDNLRSALAIYALALIYVFAWYEHHDLTHTAIKSTMIAVALFMTLRILLKKPTRLDYIVFGVICGLGFLAKYNFVLYVLALAAASLLVRQARQRFWSRGGLLALGVFVLTIAPYIWWSITHDYSFRALTEKVIHASDETNLWTTLANVWDLTVEILAFPQPWLAIVILCLPALILARGPAINDQERAVRHLLFWHMALGCLAFYAVALATGASFFKGRWMHPILLPLPIWLFAGLSAERLWARGRRLIVFVGITAATTLAIIPGRFAADIIGPLTCERCRLYFPFGALAEDLEAAGFRNGTILTDAFHIGGNLRLAFPESRLIDVNYPLSVWPPAQSGGQCLLVWHPDSDAAPTQVPESLMGFLNDKLAASVDPPAPTVIARGLIGAPSRPYELAYALFPDGAGDCQ